MKLFAVIADWRAKYFGLTPDPPRRSAPSDALLELRESAARERERDARFAAEARAHVRALAEREEVERWGDLVEQFGSAVVEAIQRRVDPTFILPEQLRGIAPPEERT